MSTTSNNASGRNQFRERPIIEDIPDIYERLQAYINQGVQQKMIPERLEHDCKQKISLSAVKKLMKKGKIKTVRNSGLTDTDKATAILKVSEQDPLGRFGCRLTKEKLGLDGIHVSRDFVMQFAKAENPSAVQNRHPVTRKTHQHGLWSSGPNEEWCMDGHEKLLQSMGIGIYGIVDKFSRMELALVAAPNVRDSRVPVVTYLRTVKERIPLSTTSDKGSEMGQLISLVQALRKEYVPYISEAQVPSHSAVKSPQNVTRERSWRPLWEKELANILHFYRVGQNEVGFQANDDFHAGLSLWVWAMVVQDKLDSLLIENRYHKIRGQQKTLLPSNARRIDLYDCPGNYDALDCKKDVPEEEIDRLLAEWDDPSLFRFGSEASVSVYNDLYRAIGSPKPLASMGWFIFYSMLNLHIRRLQVASI
ncbi:hypothetical protein NMY22_g18492 [Coprinellus aureogranulatus]|nr:hypothetical protein NMY22_g18492 [Coprinellus aureogranulatus]